MNLEAIPVEILYCIIDHLNDQDLNMLMSVGRGFMETVGPVRLSTTRTGNFEHHPIDEIVWRHFSKSEFPTIYCILRHDPKNWLMHGRVSELLIPAIRSGRARIISQLLSLGANFAEIEGKYRPPLIDMMESRYCTIEAVQLVCDQPTVKINATDTWGKNALHVAITGGWVIAAEWLLLRDANITEPDDWHRSQPWWWWDQEGHILDQCQEDHKGFEWALQHGPELRQLLRAVLEIRYAWKIGKIFNPMTIFQSEGYVPYFYSEWISKYPTGGNPHQIISNELRNALLKEDRNFVHPKDLEPNKVTDCDMFDHILWGEDHKYWYKKKWPMGLSQGPSIRCEPTKRLRR
jgi:hypothetical protein